MDRGIYVEETVDLARSQSDTDKVHVTDLSKKMQWQVSGGDCGWSYSAGMDDLAGREMTKKKKKKKKKSNTQVIWSPLHYCWGIN